MSQCQQDGAHADSMRVCVWVRERTCSSLRWCAGMSLSCMLMRHFSLFTSAWESLSATPPCLIFEGQRHLLPVPKDKTASSTWPPERHVLVATIPARIVHSHGLGLPFLGSSMYCRITASAILENWRQLLGKRCARKETICCQFKVIRSTRSKCGSHVLRGKPKLDRLEPHNLPVAQQTIGSALVVRISLFSTVLLSTLLTNFFLLICPATIVRVIADVTCLGPAHPARTCAVTPFLGFAATLHKSRQKFPLSKGPRSRVAVL